MTDNTLTTRVTTLDDGTKVLQKFRTITRPDGKTMVQSSQPVTITRITDQIAALQADLDLLND